MGAQHQDVPHNPLTCKFRMVCPTTPTCIPFSLHERSFAFAQATYLSVADLDAGRLAIVPAMSLLLSICSLIYRLLSATTHLNAVSALLGRSAPPSAHTMCLANGQVSCSVG